MLRDWPAILAPHFAAEERWLAPHAGERSADLLEQHRALRELFEGVRAALDVAVLAAFGAALDAHVRWEERELFPALEACLDAATLARIGAHLDEDGRGSACALP